MNEQLLEIVEEYREKGISVTDEDAESIRRYCLRKMDVSGVENLEEYLPLLYADEIRNHLFRMAVNATAVLRRMGEAVNV